MTLHQIAKDISISEAFGDSREAKLVLWMVYARLLGRSSRLSATRLMSQHAGCDVLDLGSFTEDDLYDAMDWVEKEQGSIEKDLFQRKYKDEVPVFYLYDVTSSYLEGAQNELGEFGYNRDGKKGKQQIVIGLMTDAEGWPIAIEVFEGNTKSINEQKKQKVMILDGCYVLKTDRKKDGISAQEIHDRYKSLTDVEWAFRTMKTTLLEMRGVFVRKASRTKAHVFIVMLSYMLAYKLRRHWHNLEVTVEEGICELSSIHAIEVHFPQMSYQQIPQPRSSTMLLLEKAGITLPDAIPLKGATALTRKKLVSERKNLKHRSL